MYRRRHILPTFGGKPVDITDRFSPVMKAGSQKPPETISEIEKLKISWGSIPPDPLSTTLFFVDEST